MLRSPELTVAAIPDQLMALVRVCKSFPAVVSLPVEHGLPLTWLAAQSTPQRIFWSDRDTADAVAGWGAADVISVSPGTLVSDSGRLELAATRQLIERCREGIGGHPLLRYFGGTSFDGRADWPGLGAARFVLPRFLMQPNRMSMVVRDASDVQRACRDLEHLIVPEFNSSQFDLRSIPKPHQVDYSPDQAGWIQNVRLALDMIEHEVLEKIVLAREARFEFAEAIDPILLTSKLFHATHSSFVFCLQWDEHQAFLGATPERLFRRRGQQLLSDVIAGTRPRGATIGEDQRLAYDLLNSDKDQLEHDIVRKSIRQKLHHLVDRLQVDSHASVLRLAGKQHLYSSVEGNLREGITEAELLHRLHPTPAVGGYPTENALPEIARLEPFSRGWYAAPLGWIGHDCAEFVVAIRSGLVQQNQLRLYSGAGIVRGSVPLEEWKEIDHKIQDFLGIFG